MAALTLQTKFKEVYGALYSHLQAKGWAKHARAIFVDEPGGAFTTSGEYEWQCFATI